MADPLHTPGGIQGVAVGAKVSPRRHREKLRKASTAKNAKGAKTKRVHHEVVMGVSTRNE